MAGSACSPKLREWIGPRQVNNLKAHGFTITNRKFESTVSVKRDDISDDRLGVFKPIVSEMGVTAKRHPDELIFGLLKSGFTTPCFDGANFFAANHAVEIDGKRTTLSNMQAGKGVDAIGVWVRMDEAVTRGMA